MKERLDKLLVDRKLFDSRNIAQRFILAGKVLVNEQTISRVGEKIDTRANIRITGAPKKYVSRGGDKLEIAVKQFGLNFDELDILDIGASTGGFTDCALQYGAKSVVCVDVGYGQLDMKLRADARVKIIEKTNARYKIKRAI